VTTLSPRIVACLAATWFIWGSTYYAIKLALAGFPPFLQNGTRFTRQEWLAVGIIVLGITVLILGRR
jgi:hypothetical protein